MAPAAYAAASTTTGWRHHGCASGSSLTRSGIPRVGYNSVMARRREHGGEQREKDFPSTKTSRAWWTLAGGSLLLLLVVIFIAQNGDTHTVRFLWIKGDVATGVALLGAAILGALTVLLLGAARILQLRRQAKRSRRSPASE